MRNFRNLEVWKEAMAFVKDIYVLSNLLPAEEKYGLTTQLRRAVISIPANIAEGASRRTSTDFARFLEIALGSSFEVETYLELILSIYGNLNQDFDLLLKHLSVIQKRINALRESILKSPSKD